jgi:Ca-activated chloride channel family protein
VPPNWNAFIRVESSAETSGRVELWQNEVKVGDEEFVLDAGESQRLVFDLESQASSRLEARMVIASDSYDSLDSDNVAFLDLSPARNLQVYAHPDLASFRHALRDIQGVEVYPADGGTANRTAEYDLVVTDQISDDELESTVYLFVGGIPRDLTNDFEVEVNLTDIIRWERSSPLLQHMQLRDVQINDDVKQAEDFTDGDLEDLGYEVLAHGRNGAMMLQKREGRKLNYFVLFHPDRSTLPYRVAFPIFVKNAVDVAFHEVAIGEVRGLKTRVLPAMSLSMDRKYQIQLPTGKTLTAKSDDKGTLAGVPAHHVGEYVVREAGEEQARRAISLLSSSESSLVGVDRILFSELAVDASDSVLDSDRPLWSMIAIIAFLVLLLEWWFYHRRPTIVSG